MDAATSQAPAQGLLPASTPASTPAFAPMERQRVLFFAPHAGIWIHAFPEALIAEAVAQRHEVLYVTCGGVLAPYCIAMSGNGLGEGASAEDKAEMCRRCATAKERLRTHFSLAGSDLEAYLDGEDRARVAALLAAATPETAPGIAIEGVPIGRFAYYEFLLKRKKVDLAFSGGKGGREWLDWLVALRNAAHSVLATRRIVAAWRPTRVVAYNSLYSVNRAACDYGERHGIPSYFLHAGGNLAHRLETMMFGRGSTLHFLRSLIGHWPRLRSVPCPGDLLAQVTDHLLEVLRGRSVFAYSAPPSAAGGVRERFGVRPGQRLVLVTMSSQDERFAAETVGAIPRAGAALFADQVEWLMALVAWAAPRGDLAVVIRVHPREFPNKREGMLSAHAEILRARLADLPGNVRVNWPSDGVSMYDLAQETDVVLNAWSSAGKEMALLGLPVVCHAPELPFYPTDIHFTGTTRETYFAAIEQALAEGWSPERMRLAYRWCALEYGRSLIALGDAFRDPMRPAPLARRVVRRVGRAAGLDLDPLIDCLLKPEVIAEAQVAAAVIGRGVDTRLDLGEAPATTDLASETAGLRREARRLAEGLGRLPGVPPSRLSARLRAFAGEGR
jgi:hypothetical protein